MDTTRAIQVAVARADVILCSILRYGRIALLSLVLAAGILAIRKRRNQHE